MQCLVSDSNLGLEICPTGAPPPPSRPTGTGLRHVSSGSKGPARDLGKRRKRWVRDRSLCSQPSSGATPRPSPTRRGGSSCSAVRPSPHEQQLTMGFTVRVPSTDRGDRMEPGTDSAAFRIIYCGMATVMAVGLIHGNVYTNRGCIDTTVDPWKACRAARHLSQRHGHQPPRERPRGACPRAGYVHPAA